MAIINPDTLTELKFALMAPKSAVKNQISTWRVCLWKYVNYNWLTSHDWVTLNNKYLKIIAIHTRGDWMKSYI